MLNQKIKLSPHGNFQVTKLLDNIAICEAIEDRHNWNNATEDQPAFIVYLGCKKSEVSSYVKTLNIFYRCDWCEVRSPKHLKDFKAEIKIRGMQRYTDAHAFGLDYLVKSESVKPTVTPVAKQPENKYIITLDDCLEDMAANFIYEESEYSQVPPFVLIPLMFEAVNELIDQFSSSPEKYISHALRQKIDETVRAYLAAA